MNQAVCAIYMMDVKMKQSDALKTLTKHRFVVNEQCRPDIISILVVNKMDIPLRKFDKEQGKELAGKTGFMKYIEISSKEGTNTGKVMESILVEVERKSMWQTERRQTISLMSTRYGGSQKTYLSGAKLKDKARRGTKDKQNDPLNQFGFSNNNAAT